MPRFEDNLKTKPPMPNIVDDLHKQLANEKEVHSVTSALYEGTKNALAHSESQILDAHQGIADLNNRIIAANNRIKVLEKALEFYRADDEAAVNCGILGDINDRPAAMALIKPEELKFGSKNG